AGGETGAPRSPRGTRLKATTERAFLVSAGLPPAGAATEEACSSLPAVRNGISPFQSKAAQAGREPTFASASPSRAGDELRSASSGGTPPPELWGERHDCAHPRIP